MARAGWLRYRADWQTVAYMVLATVLLIVQWRAAQFSAGLYLLTLFLAFAISIMNHNHCHLPMWNVAWLNRASDCWFTLFLGHPGFVFEWCHEHNHHRHRNRDADWTRTWRHRDDNCLSGFVRHPFESAISLRPHIAAGLRHIRRRSPREFRQIAAQYLLLALFVGGALWLDAQKAVLYVLIPQFTALFFLLGANYLQHAHTDEANAARHSRNFTGLVNPLCFNIGYHSAHHQRGKLHWSLLPAAHARIASTIDPRLIERSLLWYCLRVFVLSAWVTKFKSQPLREPCA